MLRGTAREQLKKMLTQRYPEQDQRCTEASVSLFAADWRMT